MKRIFTLLTLLCIFLKIGLTPINASSGERSWYIKRNGQCRPIIQRDQELIYNYNGYFIDKKLIDGGEEKRLYITFDAGYENGNVEKILDVMKKESVVSAFFLLDNIILQNTELVTRMANEGHLVCNHTKNHKNLSSSDKEEIAQNLLALEEIYEQCTGQKMAKYFRFPEGRYSEQALKSVSELGYKTIFWSFAYEDWMESSKLSDEKALKKILDNTHNGAVILLHPTSSTNARIFERLITEWRNMGYTFGTLDELVS